MNAFEEFLIDTAEFPPCGPDLTYDADFMAMEGAARGKPEQQFGDTVISAEPPDWRDVERQALALMRRTKDLRVAILLCRAWTQLRGLPGTAEGLKLIVELLERYWGHLHPEPEDGDDWFIRMNTLASLNEITGFLRELREEALLQTSLGVVRVRDAEALAKGSTVEGVPNFSGDQLRIAIMQARADGDERLLALDHCAVAIERLVQICDQRFPEHQQPEFTALRLLFKTLGHWQLAPVCGVDDEPPALAEDVVRPSTSGPATPTYNRESVIVQLLDIATLLEQSEPTNPAPLLIRRAVRFMRMGFIDILKELSPDCVHQIENITGKADP